MKFNKDGTKLDFYTIICENLQYVVGREKNIHILKNTSVKNMLKLLHKKPVFGLYGVFFLGELWVI